MNSEESSMATTKAIPVQITPEAAAHVASLGMQRELEQMLAHTQEAVLGVKAIDVILAEPCDPGDDPRVILEVTKPVPKGSCDPAEMEWGKWIVRTFSPDVGRHFVMLAAYGGGGAG
jgi:hypothetical protein